MKKRFWDLEDGNLFIPISKDMAMDTDGKLFTKISDHMAIDTDGNLHTKVSDNMFMDMDTGRMHFVSGWESDDDE